MKQAIVLHLITIVTLLTGCVSPQQDSSLGEHETLYKNPNPEIEAIHLQAFNLDMGNGVKQDRAKANPLYLQAAQAGDPRSMLNYSINRFYGYGIDPNPVDAFYWVDKARFATQQSSDSKLKWRIRGFYDEVEKSLTKDQIKEARSRK